MHEIVFYACGEFWKDVRKLKKHIRSDFLECTYNDEEFERLQCAEKLECVPVLRQITTALKNKINVLNEIPNNHKNAKHQPFLPIDFIVWKLRWGVDNKGPAYGLRMMYCVKGRHIVLANVKHKKEIATSEDDFQAETIERLKYFFDYEYK